MEKLNKMVNRKETEKIMMDKKGKAMAKNNNNNKMDKLLIIKSDPNKMENNKNQNVIKQKSMLKGVIVQKIDTEVSAKKAMT